MQRFEGQRITQAQAGWSLSGNWLECTAPTLGVCQTQSSWFNRLFCQGCSAERSRSDYKSPAGCTLSSLSFLSITTSDYSLPLFSSPNLSTHARRPSPRTQSSLWTPSRMRSATSSSKAKEAVTICLALLPLAAVRPRMLLVVGPRSSLNSSANSKPALHSSGCRQN